MKNWYCKPASEAEAVEIVRRAIANGAVVKEVPLGFDFSCAEFPWDYCAFWGVHDGNTFTHDVVGDDFKRLTIQQVREQFPRPNEVKAMSDKKEWQGMQDGFPPAEIDIEVKKDGRWIGAMTVGKYYEWMVCAPFGGGFYGFSIDDMRPLRTDREKWVDAACAVFHGRCMHDYSGQHFDDAIGAVYDAIKSGTLKAPEAE